jgi:single-stranded DNA-binding protein
MAGEIEATVEGHLAADAVVKLVGDKEVAELRIAVGVRRPDSAGSWSDVRTDWVDVSVWGFSVGGAATLKKGQLVRVSGRLTPAAYISKTGEAQASLSLSTLDRVLVVARAPQLATAGTPAKSAA